MNSGDPDPARVVALLRRAWDRRECHDPDAAELSDAARALSDSLAGTDPTHTSAELHDRVDTPVDDEDLPQLERLVFAHLLEALDG